MGAALHLKFREFLLHAQARQPAVCVAYCLMPDHVHVLWHGTSGACDQRLGIRFLHQELNRLLQPCKLQKQPFDHVLRPEERERDAMRAIAYYIVENPVRKGLAGDAADYPYSGCVVQGYPRLDVHEAGHWEKFWRICAPMLKE